MSLRCCCSGLPPRVGCGLWTVGTVDRGRGDTPHPPRALARDAAARAAVAARARTQITYRVRGVPRVTHDEVGRDAVDFVPFCPPVPPVEPREGEREREAGCGGGGRCPVPFPNPPPLLFISRLAWRARRRDGALALRRRVHVCTRCSWRRDAHLSDEREATERECERGAAARRSSALRARERSESASRTGFVMIAHPESGEQQEGERARTREHVARARCQCGAQPPRV